ncbi:MAG TPA: phosphate signaling complex protein PhoU [Anaerolineales bacterium]|nr:phosphate signaling complex protein PhoU [Anaerolineales bacterium]
MTRERLDRQLNQLREDILFLGSMVEQATLEAVDALKRRDITAARRIYADDEKINRKRFDTESAALITIATQQPMAHDLRILAAVLEVITELERMGDYAKGIARICINLADEPLLKPLIDIPMMAEKTVDMLHRALEAFVREDAETARLIPKEDDEIDDLFNAVQNELLQIMIADPSTVDRANHLLWAAHNLERMADRVTNICERTVFIATGEMTEFDRTDDELTNL